MEKTAVANHLAALGFHVGTFWVHLHPKALFWDLPVVGIKSLLLMHPEECRLAHSTSVIGDFMGTFLMKPKYS